jgi:hypothetical protein
VTLTLDQGPSATSHAPSNDDRYALDVPSGRDRLSLAVAAIRLKLLNRGCGPNPLVGLLRFGSASGKQEQQGVSHGTQHIQVALGTVGKNSQ